MLALATLACGWGGAAPAALRTHHPPRGLPPAARVFDVEEARRRLDAAVAREDYAEAARLKREIDEGGTGAAPATLKEEDTRRAETSETKETWIRSLDSEEFEEKEPWVPEPGRFFGTSAEEDVASDESKSGANEPWEPEPGKFFNAQAGVVSETSGSKLIAEGYWAPLMEAPDRLRASDLNEVLQPDYMDRLRYRNSPMMAYGALFKWELLIQNVLQLFMIPWEKVAAEHNLPAPDEDEVARAVGMRPERAIQQIFRWTDDWGFSQKLAFEHYEAQASVFQSFEFKATEGAIEWLRLLNNYSVPCCCCAPNIDVETAKLAMSRAGLADFFGAYVTAEDGCDTALQSYLIASIKVSLLSRLSINPGRQRPATHLDSSVCMCVGATAAKELHCI